MKRAHQMQIKTMNHKSIKSLLTITIALASAAAFSFELPSDWPQLKPGMYKTEMKMSGMKAVTTQQCITKTMLDETKAASDKFLKAEKGCKSFEYSKSGNVHSSKRECSPPGAAPYVDLAEATFLSTNQVKAKSSRVERGNKVVFEQETLTTRLGDCTGKESPAAGSLEDKIQKAMEEAQANSNKKNKK
jgi:Protein of unknown function (DUF3617)